MHPVTVLPDTIFVEGAKITLITVESLHVNLMFGRLVNFQCLFIPTDIAANITDVTVRSFDPFVNPLLMSSQTLRSPGYKRTIRTGKAPDRVEGFHVSPQSDLTVDLELTLITVVQGCCQIHFLGMRIPGVLL